MTAFEDFQLEEGTAGRYYKEDEDNDLLLVEDDIPSLLDEVLEQPDPGVGFIDGPVWHYPEEEIEFYPSEDEDESIDESVVVKEDRNPAKETYTSTNIKNIKMSESYDGIAHEHDDRSENDDVSSDGQSREEPASLGAFDWNAAFGATNRPTTRRRRRPRRSHAAASSYPDTSPEELQRFREATRCVPFEYTSQLCTLCVRRPYGIPTDPELFRSLCGEGDQDYGLRSRASSSQTIQVAIRVGADRSLMLLYGEAGVRYKKNPNDTRWTDVPDIGALDVPLGYVHRPHGEEYSLDEVLEEAMLVREQYCSTLLSAALDLEQHQLLATTTAATTPTITSPPSLVKSIVSTTPPRTKTKNGIFYYDGSSNSNVSFREHEKDSSSEQRIKGKRLDFQKCLSPSVVSLKSRETLKTRESQLTRRTRQQRIKQRRRRKIYRFCQRVVIIVVFYCSGIFLVANLSSSSLERNGSRSLLAMLVPVQFLATTEKDENNPNILVSLWGKYLEQTEGTATKASSSSSTTTTTTAEDSTADEQPKGFFRIVDIFFPSSTERIERECRTSLEAAFNETHAYQEELEKTRALLREETSNREALWNLYVGEQSQALSLLQEKEEAVGLVKELESQTKTLLLELELERFQQHQLGEKVLELERELESRKEQHQQRNNQKGDSDSLEAATATVDTGSEEHDVPSGIHVIEPATIAPNKNQSLAMGQNRSHGNDWFGPLARKELQIQSYETSVLLNSARANTGPVLPKVYRQITKHFLPHLGVKLGKSESSHGPTAIPTDNDFERTKKKVQVLAASVKNAIQDNVQTIAAKTKRRRATSGNNDRTERHPLKQRARESLSNAGDFARKEARTIRRATIHSTEILVEKLHVTEILTQSKELSHQWKQEASIALEKVVQSISPEFLETTKAMLKKIKSSTDKVLQHSKEGSEVVRKQVQKNLEEATTVGIGKLDRQQDAIAKVGGLAKDQLESLGKMAVRFWKSQQEQHRSSQQGQVSTLQHKLLGSNQYYKGFVGKPKARTTGER